MARWRGITLQWKRPTVVRQQVLPYVRRSWRRERAFKAAILAATALTLAGILAGSPAGRHGIRAASNRVRWGALSLVGLEPPRAEIEAERQRSRWRGVDWTRAALAHEIAVSGPHVGRMLRAARMDPETAVVRWGNFDQTLVLSSDVFEPDDAGRSYRFKPCARSIWITGLFLRGASCMFQVPDTPEAIAACAAAGGRPVPGSIQITNSWGCRGREPDTRAPFRGIVLGDSVMQGALVGDDETPPACLERELAKRTGMRVSVLNTAVLGYSPEQYYHTLRGFFGRMSPHFVIVSLCGNDFGGAYNPANYVESCYWLEQIVMYCQAREVPFLIVPWPGEDALLGRRDESHYPGQVSHLLKFGGTRYFYPIEAFATEDLRLRIELRKKGEPENMSALYNRRHWGDDHFSSLGCALWGKVVADRLLPFLQWRQLLPANPGAPTPSSPPRGPGLGSGRAEVATER